MAFLSLVVPAFNEADAIGPFRQRLDSVFATLRDIEPEFVFVNDGSTDATLELLLRWQAEDARVRIVDLSRNFGKEAALTAGLDAAQGEVVAVIDVDLQDPPELLAEMIEKWRAGFEVVVARRVNRDVDSWAKRSSARAFYALHNRIATPSIPANVGDFRLMDRCVVDALKRLPESRRFMTGLFAWAGFRTATVDYSRPMRSAGASKFNGWKLWNLALEGITSFSTVPLRFWSYLGFTVSLGAFFYALVIVVRVLVQGVDVPGYASLMVSIMFLGGLQLVGIGVLGEYLGRTYIESKRRPVYLIRQLHEPAARPSPLICSNAQTPTSRCDD